MDARTTQNCTIDLATWLAQPAGQYLCAWEQAHLDKLTTDIFGFNAVQIGQPQIHGLAASRMPNKWLTNNVAESLLDLEASDAPSGVVHPDRRIVVLHDFAELPFASQSLDLVVLPHILEFTDEPHQLLREIERVLIPEGRLIICGFNPVSLWGLRQALGHVTGSHFLPKHNAFISLPRLKDWLELLNLRIDDGQFGCYAPAFTRQKWLQRCSFIEFAGQRWWPFFGAVYILQAIKRVKGMHLIGPAWKKKPLLLHSGVPAANRHHTSEK
jgi:SAM-dependent methyltransferase